jgi:hypothetical protein
MQTSAAQPSAGNPEGPTPETVPVPQSLSEREWTQIARAIERGEPHHTLGTRLRSGLPWHKAGKADFKRFNSILRVRRTDRVIDYGCGTLRIGLHFIKRLRPGNYMGLDLIPQFIESGQRLLGEKLLRKASPALACINQESLLAAERFGATIVISSDVAFHVHPNEVASYFGNLRRLAHTPGAYQYNESGWSWPLTYYQELLKPLVFVGTHYACAYYFDSRCVNCLLEFRTL